ncbi:MAG: YdcF family protein [Polyangiaceae bacterium]
MLSFAPPVFFTWSLPASTFIDPLLWLLVVMAVGLYYARGSFTGDRGKRAFRVLLGAWIALWVLSTPLVTALLLWQMEPWPADIAPSLDKASADKTALVVLSGGMRGPPWLPRFERMNGGSLPRAIGAADVYKAHPGKFGVVIASGRAPGTPDTADAMADALVLFGVPRDRIVLEPDSETTRASAENTARLLKERGIETTVLVTSALHMRRAAAELERAGVHVIMAPVDHTVRPLGGLDMLFPDAGSLSRLDEIVHELVGRLKP